MKNMYFIFGPRAFVRNVSANSANSVVYMSPLEGLVWAASVALAKKLGVLRPG